MPVITLNLGGIAVNSVGAFGEVLVSISGRTYLGNELFKVGFVFNVMGVLSLL